MPPQVDQLAKSLQQMIVDCQNAIANWCSKSKPMTQFSFL